MHLSFVSAWVEPRELFLVTKKPIQSPWVQGIKLMTNSPSLGGSMNTHNIISFTSCQKQYNNFLQPLGARGTFMVVNCLLPRENESSCVTDVF